MQVLLQDESWGGRHTSSLDFLDTQGTLHCEASGFPDLSIGAPLHVHCQYAAYTQLQRISYKNQ